MTMSTCIQLILMSMNTSMLQAKGRSMIMSTNMTMVIRDRIYHR